MIASIQHHPRGHDLLTLAALCNERATDNRCVYDLTRPLRLAYEGGDYWYLWGTATTGTVLQYSWVAVQLEGQPERYREELERCYGIEATLNAEVALDRLLAVERRRAAKAQAADPIAKGNDADTDYFNENELEEP
jgi:hypothetical protein